VNRATTWPYGSVEDGRTYSSANSTWQYVLAFRGSRSHASSAVITSIRSWRQRYAAPLKKRSTKMADLPIDRQGLTKSFVERLADCIITAKVAADDMKMVLDEAKGEDYSARELAAMKTVAKLKADGKEAQAKAKLAALDKVSRAVGMDLFDWSDSIE
jgi:uncharacterized protein (UPF0335 family)